MVFDGHGDIWTDVTCRAMEYGERDIFRSRHLDKFRRGNVDGGIFVIWIDPPHDRTPVNRSEQIVRCLRQELEDASDIIGLVKEFGDFEKERAGGKITVVNGMEGLSQIGEDIDLLNWFYDEVGVRHAMLTWNETNLLATGWTGDRGRGLTEKGRQAVRRIQDLGMVMDVSHLNDKSFWGVVDVTQKPLIASHSNARGICGTMRNIDDDMIKAIAETGGLLGMNSIKEFISLDFTRQNVEGLADHVEYIADLVGTDYIGLGYDFDDYLGHDALAAFTSNVDSPGGEGVKTEADASNLLHILKGRGFTADEIEKIAYKNFYRVFKKCWK